jgi:hypothetical protein
MSEKAGDYQQAADQATERASTSQAKMARLKSIINSSRAMKDTLKAIRAGPERRKPLRAAEKF